MRDELLCLALVPFLLPQGAAPDRTVSGTTLRSSHDPKVQIRLPESARYVGADRWNLYDLADCELHVFVQADAANLVHGLYWIQFEGYLPSKPDAHHMLWLASLTS